MDERESIPSVGRRFRYGIFGQILRWRLTIGVIFGAVVLGGMFVGGAVLSLVNRATTTLVEMSPDPVGTAAFEAFQRKVLGLCQRYESTKDENERLRIIDEWQKLAGAMSMNGVQARCRRSHTDRSYGEDFAEIEVIHGETELFGKALAAAQPDVYDQIDQFFSRQDMEGCVIVYFDQLVPRVPTGGYAPNPCFHNYDVRVLRIGLCQ